MRVGDRQRGEVDGDARAARRRARRPAARRPRRAPSGRCRGSARSARPRAGSARARRGARRARRRGAAAPRGGTRGRRCSETIGWKCSTNRPPSQRAAQALEPRASVQPRRRAEALAERARIDEAAPASAGGRSSGRGTGAASHPCGRAQHRHGLRRRCGLTCARDAPCGQLRAGATYGRRARSEITSSSATSTKFITTEEPP